MPRVNIVKKARKDYPNAGIKKGDTYYWWKFRYGGKHMSLTPPKRSQLTQSDFLAQVYELEDQIEALEPNENIQEAVEGIVQEIQSLRDETEDKLYAMPDHLQETSDSGILLQERMDYLEEWASELENIDFDVEVDREDVADNVGRPARDEFDTHEEYEMAMEDFEIDVDAAYQDELDERYQEILSEVQSATYNGS